jgi:hypothetical protein
VSKADPPTPPNPIATAGAQTASNVSTAVANAFLNNVNQQTPLGGLNYNVTGNFDFTDPNTGQTYSIPRFTAEQNLSGPQQSIQNQSEQAKLNLAGLASQQSGKLGSLLGSNIDLSGAPASGTVPFLQQGLAGSIGPPQFFSGSGGNITRSYGPADDFSSDRGRVEQALYGRLNPQLALEQQHIEQQLSDQGIRAGSPAYRNAMDAYARQANDARLAVTQTAGQEQQRMMDMAAQRAGFQNAAQAQAYNQDLQQKQLYNAAEQQMFAQQAARDQFYNNVAAQQFNMANVARPQYLAEQYALRNQPINEITALLSGSQVQQPQFMNLNQGQIPTSDIAGLINQNFAQQFGNYQQQNQASNQLIGGLFGLGGNLATAGAYTFGRSDRRVKENIHRVGTVFAATPQPVEEPEGGKKKLPIYEYSFKDDPASTRHVGPMAQDVEKVDPKAVRSFGGVKHIDKRRVMGSILKAA